MPFILCTEEELYALRLVPIIGAILTRRIMLPLLILLNYVAFTCPHDTIHFLTSFDYWFKETIFDERSDDKTGLNLFVD